MNKLFNVSSSPHVRGEDSTRSIMYDVALALLPATAFGVYHFGLYSLLVVLVSIGFAVLSEYMFQTLTGQKVRISDGSALLTGLLIGLNMPPAVPLWIPALGSMFAIIFVKQFFGGLGQNFMNPALGARCFLLISFTGLMSDFSADGISGATPLALLKDGQRIDLPAMLTGFTGGTIGEVSALAVLIGGIYLLVKKVITWEIPVLYIATFAIFEFIFGANACSLTYVLAEICGGGLLLGAFFMATDYVTSPITKNGKIMFGVLLGILTGVFRTFGVSAEGVSYAIIIANLLVPLIEKISMPVTFGFEKGNPLAPAKQAPAKTEKNTEDANTVNKTTSDSKISLATYKAACMLCVITLVAGAALGTAYQLTKGPIEEAEMAALADAFKVVCPDADKFAESEELTAAIANATAEDGTVLDGAYGNLVFDNGYAALDASGNTTGYVVNVTSKEGFGGEIQMSIGFTVDGAVTGIEFLSISETAGLGMRATESDFKDQYADKPVDTFELVKESPSAENQIQAISGATITSTAVTNAVNATLKVIQSMAE